MVSLCLALIHLGDELATVLFAAASVTKSAATVAASPTPVRQWVLSLPKRLRGFLHRVTALAGKVLRILLEEVERELRRQCPDAGAKARTSAVVFSHRFGASLNAYYHFHACVIEGLYEAKGEGVRFHAAAELSDAHHRAGSRAGAPPGA